MYTTNEPQRLRSSESAEIQIGRLPLGDYYGQAPSDELSLQDFIRVLQKRRWAVLVTALITLVLISFWTFSTTRLYEASSRLAIYPENADALGIKELETAFSEDRDYQVSVKTQLNILQDPALAAAVISSLKLHAHPAFSIDVDEEPPASTDPLAVAEIDAAIKAELVDRFGDSLEVEAIKGTRLIEIRFLSPDPQLSAAVVNELMKAYIEQNFRTKYESTTQTSDWLAKQLSELQMRMEASQEKLVRYQKEAGILGADEKENIVTAKLDALNRELLAAEADRIQKEANYELAKSASPDLVAKLVQNSPLDRLRTQEADLSVKLAQLSTTLGAANPKVIEVQNQITTIQGKIQTEVDRIGSTLQNDYRAAVQREKMLRQVFELQKREANQLNESAIQYTALKRDADSNRALYEGLLARLKEAGITAGLRSNNVRIIRPAEPPVKPARPNVPVNLAMGLFGGIFLGVVLAFAIEAIDNTVHSPEDAQAVAALPSLGVIPLAISDATHRRRLRGTGTGKLLPPTSNLVAPGTALTALNQPKSQVAEAYRALRTSLLFASIDAHGPRVVLFTSALPQEGKTMSSANTAIVFAHKGDRVLLVDTDLRRPSIHKVFGLPMRGGLSSVLSNRATFEQVVLRSTIVPNLDILPTGPSPANPAEMLGSPAMRDLIMKWREEYDRVIIDSPPILPVTDPVLLSALVDGVVVVIRSGKTTKNALRRTREILAQANANVFGILVNGIDVRSPEYYHYYGASYDGRYYGEPTP